MECFIILQIQQKQHHLRAEEAHWSSPSRHCAVITLPCQCTCDGDAVSTSKRRGRWPTAGNNPLGLQVGVYSQIRLVAYIFHQLSDHCGLRRQVVASTIYQFRPRASTFLFLDIFYSLQVRIKDDAEFHHATDTRGNGIYDELAMPFVVIIALL